jgi:hypothetical protein
MQKKLLGKMGLIVSVSLFITLRKCTRCRKNVKQKIVNDNGTPSLITFNEQSTYKSTEAQRVSNKQLKQNSNYAKTK